MASLIAKLWMRLCRRQTALSIMIVGLDNSGKTSILNYLVGQNHQSEHGSMSTTSTTSSLDTSTATSSSNKRNTSIGTRKRDQDKVSPTIGYNYEIIHYNGLALTVLDFSGQNRYRNLWQEFYNCIDAIVYVIDSSDLIRLVVVRDELEIMLAHSYFGTLTGDGNQPGPIYNGAQKQITVDQGRLIQSPLESATLNSAQPTKSLPTSSQSTQFKNQMTNKNITSRRHQRTKIPILFLANKCDLANSVDTDVIVKALNLSQLPEYRHPWFIQATSVKLNQGINEGFNWLVQQLSLLLAP